jgi:serine/threonine protein kinase
MGASSIHNSGVLHRDFKMDNILLDSSYSTVKICDFGVSKLIKQGEIIKEQCGTPAYIAPEIIKNEGYEGYTVDIWSLGVVLYTMLCGTIPFKANNINDLHTLILSGNFDLPFDLSVQAKDLIVKMIKLNPYERISIENALKHEWFNVRMKEVDRTTPQFFPRIFKEKDEEIRENVVKAVAELGFERDFVVKSLKANEMNHATVSYYLMM